MTLNQNLIASSLLAKCSTFTDFRAVFKAYVMKGNVTVLDVVTLLAWKILNLEGKSGCGKSVARRGTTCSNAKNQHVHKQDGKSKKASPQKPKKLPAKSASHPKPNGQKARKDAPKNKPVARKPSKATGKNPKR